MKAWSRQSLHRQVKGTGWCRAIGWERKPSTASLCLLSDMCRLAACLSHLCMFPRVSLVRGEQHFLQEHLRMLIALRPVRRPVASAILAIALSFSLAPTGSWAQALPAPAPQVEQAPSAVPAATPMRIVGVE